MTAVIPAQAADRSDVRVAFLGDSYVTGLGDAGSDEVLEVFVVRPHAAHFSNVARFTLNPVGRVEGFNRTERICV